MREVELGLVSSDLLTRVERDRLVVGRGRAEAAHEVNETSSETLGHDAVEQGVHAAAEVVAHP